MQIYTSQRTQHSVSVHLACEGTLVTGCVRGPFCRYSKTLPSTFTFGNKDSLSIIDPCYWSPELPFRYRVQCTVQSDAGEESIEFAWGLRRCEPHGTDLRLDGKRGVVRAVSWPQPDGSDLARVRELSGALLVSNPSHEFCAEASESGVMLIADLRGHADVEAQLLSLNRHPAVHFAVVDRADSKFSGSDIVPVIEGLDDAPTGCVVMADMSSLSDQLPQRPIFITSKSNAASLESRRRECDILQRDAVSYGQFAGYVVFGDVA